MELLEEKFDLIITNASWLLRLLFEGSCNWFCLYWVGFLFLEIYYIEFIIWYAVCTDVTDMPRSLVPKICWSLGGEIHFTLLTTYYEYYIIHTKTALKLILRLEQLKYIQYLKNYLYVVNHDCNYNYLFQLLKNFLTW